MPCIHLCEISTALVKDQRLKKIEQRTGYGTKFGDQNSCWQIYVCNLYLQKIQRIRMYILSGLTLHRSILAERLLGWHMKCSDFEIFEIC